MINDGHNLPPWLRQAGQTRTGLNPRRQRSAICSMPTGRRRPCARRSGSDTSGPSPGAINLLFFQQTHRIVFTLIVRITGNREAAEELTLDVFHDVWRRASTYDPSGGSVVGWILNQARSRAIDRLGFEQRKKRIDNHAEPPRVTAESGPQEVLDVREQGRLLRQAMEVLTPEERAAIEVAFFSELTYSEVAARLNQPLGTVKTRIRSGLTKLRQALAGTVKGL